MAILSCELLLPYMPLCTEFPFMCWLKVDLIKYCSYSLTNQLMKIPTNLGHCRRWHWSHSFHWWNCFFFRKWVIGWHDTTYWLQNIVVPWQLDSLHGYCHFRICTAWSITVHFYEATLICMHKFHSPFVCKNGKLHGCGEVLGRTCRTKYTSTQSFPSLNTVHNEYDPIYIF